MDKTRICNLKLSDELFHLKLISDCNENELLFYKDLAAGQINIEFLSSSHIAGKIQTSFCIRSKFYNQVKTLLTSDVSLKTHAEFFPSIGLISLYPHRFSLKILGRSLKAFSDICLPIYGFASSISSITFMTDYNRLREAEKALKGYPVAGV